jgi:hypothetical protein
MLVEKVKGTLIINGDLFDMAASKFDLFEAINCNPRFWNALCQLPRTFVIPGNHDDKLRSIALHSGKLAANIYLHPDHITEKGIYIEHMHQAGKMFTGHSFWKVLYWPVSLLEKLRGPQALKWLELILRDLYNTASDLKNMLRLVKKGLSLALPFIRFRTDVMREEDLWVEKKVNSIINRVRAVHKEHGNQIYIGGHEHFAGVAATFKKVINGVRADNEIGSGQVKFYCSGGWKGREGYAGDFLVIDFTDENNPMVYPFVWQYSSEPVVAFQKLI